MTFILFLSGAVKQRKELETWGDKEERREKNSDEFKLLYVDLIL